jgi:HSP20 family protein
MNHLTPINDNLPELHKGFIPPVNVYEQGNHVIVETAIPGVDPKDVEVTVEGGVLTVRGKSEKSTEVDEKDYYFKEMRYGAFQRRIALPAPVLGEKAEATAEHGVLKVTIPKAEEGGGKEVKIEVKQK